MVSKHDKIGQEPAHKSVFRLDIATSIPWKTDALHNIHLIQRPRKDDPGIIKQEISIGEIQQK